MKITIFYLSLILFISPLFAADIEIGNELKVDIIFGVSMIILLLDKDWFQQWKK